jgi:hypothetical protein
MMMMITTTTLTIPLLFVRTGLSLSLFCEKISYLTMDEVEGWKIYCTTGWSKRYTKHTVHVTTMLYHQTLTNIPYIHNIYHGHLEMGKEGLI